MNFLFYAPQMAAYGGIERHVCSLAAAAADRGHTVRLLTTSNSLGDELRAELDHPRISFRELPRSRGSSGPLRKIAWLFNEVRRSWNQRWDVIYTNGQSALSRLVWQAAGPRTRVVHHHHTAADAAERATWSHGYRRVLATAPELVACSDATRLALNAATGRTDTRYLPYLAACPVSRAQIRDRAPNTTVRFGFCGRLIPEKGIDMILALAADAALPDVEWHVHGAGPAYPPQRFVGHERITYEGSFTSSDAHAQALLGLDAIVLFSEHNEGMPLSLIEGMSAGLPWIATDRGGVRELALSAANSIVLPPSPNLGECRSAVRQMAERIRTGVSSRTAQRDAYDSRFAPPAVAARWLEYFES